MKNIFVLSTCLLLFISCKKEASETIIFNTVVQDYSDMFSEEEEEKLAKKILDYEKLTTNQICVYTINTIPKNKEALEHASTLASNLGVGTKEKNNGLLILISKVDRKMAIATGTETGKTITDALALSIIENTIIPEFKNDLYFKGVNAGLDSIMLQWR